MKFFIKRQLMLFLFIGISTVLVDFTVYQILISFVVINISLAKGSGFIIGTIFAYFANRFWTFKYKGNVSRSIYRFVPLYSSTLAINIIVNAVILDVFGDTLGIRHIAFITATGCSAMLNFLGMKYFVFRLVDVQEGK